MTTLGLVQGVVSVENTAGLLLIDTTCFAQKLLKPDTKIRVEPKDRIQKQLMTFCPPLENQGVYGTKQAPRTTTVFEESPNYFG